MLMRMRGQQIVIDEIPSVEDLGELTKIGILLGYDVLVTGDDEEPDSDRGDDIEEFVQLTLRRRAWGRQELVALAALMGYVDGLSGEQIVEQVRTGLADLQYPKDRPIQDVMSIGSTAPGRRHNRD